MTIKNFLSSNVVKRFGWNTFNGFLGLVVVFLSGINWIYAPIVIAILNGASKEINTYLSEESDS